MEHIKCLRCGRRLKSEQSRELGYGEICWKKANHTNKIYNLCGISSDNAVSNSSDKQTRKSEN